MIPLSRYFKTLKNISHLRFVSSNDRVMNTIKEKKPILYGDEASPPVRFVMMTAYLLGIELDFHQIDLFRGEQKSALYKQINPLQKVPALAVNENIIIRDSHAIAIYLCQQSNNQDLYPKDNLAKVKVDEMLFFNACELFPIDSAIISGYFAGTWPAQEKHLLQWKSLLDHIENMLNQNIWLVDDKMRLCDICCASTISSMQLLLPPIERHAKLNQWMKKLESLPCFEINMKGLERLNRFVKNSNVSV